MEKIDFLAMSLPHDLRMLVEKDYADRIIDNIELLHGISIIGNCISIGCRLDGMGTMTKLNYCKPILYPLSDFELLNLDITDEIAIRDIIGEWNIIGNLDFSLAQRLVEEHFDLAGLIAKGEAIDVNTLPTNPYHAT